MTFKFYYRGQRPRADAENGGHRVPQDDDSGGRLVTDGGESIDEQCTIAGTVTQCGEPVDDVLIRAFDVDLRSSERLGEARSDEAGRYRIDYPPSAHETAEHGTADLQVEVYDHSGRLLGESDVCFNAGTEVTLDLSISDAVRVEPTEFGCLRARSVRS